MWRARVAAWRRHVADDGFGAPSAASAVDQGSSAGGGRGPGVGAPSARGAARSKSPRRSIFVRKIQGGARKTALLGLTLT